MCEGTFRLERCAGTENRGLGSFSEAVCEGEAPICFVTAPVTELFNVALKRQQA